MTFYDWLVLQVDRADDDPVGNFVRGFRADLRTNESLRDGVKRGVYKCLHGGSAASVIDVLEAAFIEWQVKEGNIDDI